MPSPKRFCFYLDGGPSSQHTHTAVTGSVLAQGVLDTLGGSRGSNNEHTDDPLYLPSRSLLQFPADPLARQQKYNSGFREASWRPADTERDPSPEYETISSEPFDPDNEGPTPLENPVSAQIVSVGANTTRGRLPNADCASSALM